MMSSPVAYAEAGRPARVRPGVIVSIVRRDLHGIWPLALALALTQLAVSAFFQVQADYPSIVVRFGESQLHVDAMLLALSQILLPAAIVLLLLVIVQHDIAAAMQHDWLTRPIAPLEIVAAKLLLIMALLVSPMILGGLAYMAMKDASPADVLMPAATALTCGLFIMMLAWLFSSPVQALLGFLTLMCIAVLIAALTLAAVIALGMSSAHAAGLPIDVRPSLSAPPPNWATTSVQLAIQIAAAVIVLWLLLARRSVFAARRVFFVGFALSMIVVFAQFGVTFPPETTASGNSQVLFADNRQEALITPPVETRP